MNLNTRIYFKNPVSARLSLHHVNYFFYELIQIFLNFSYSILSILVIEYHHYFDFQDHSIRTIITNEVSVPWSNE